MKKGRIFAGGALLALILIVSLLTVSAFAMDGNGTETDPYLVTNDSELREAINSDSSGTTYIKLNADITLSNHLLINKSVVIDGTKGQPGGDDTRFDINGKIIAISGNNTNVTFKNLEATRTTSGTEVISVGAEGTSWAPDGTTPTVTIENCNISIHDSTSTTSGASIRAIRLNGGNLTITNSTVTSSNNSAPGYSSAICVDGPADAENQVKKVLTINNSTIKDEQYYAIFSFDDTADNLDISINNSTIEGWAALYIKSDDATVDVVNNSQLIGTNPHSSSGNHFSTIILEGAEGAEISVDSSSIVRATSSAACNQYVVGFYYGNDPIDSSVEIEGTIELIGSHSGVMFSYSQGGADDPPFNVAPDNPVVDISSSTIIVKDSSVDEGTSGFTITDSNGTFKNICSTLSDAFNTAQSGDRVVMNTDSELTTAIPSGVTLVVPEYVTLTVQSEQLAYLATGSLEVQAGGIVKFGETPYVGGDGALLNLTEGTMTLSIAEGAANVTVNGDVTVNDVFKTLIGSNIRMSITANGDLTVAEGAVLDLVNNSKLTIADNGTLTVNAGGILEIHNDADLIGNATVTGTVYVFNGDADHNPVSDAAFTLTSAGTLYAENAGLNLNVTPAQMVEVSHQYTSQSAGVDRPTTFVNQWTLSYKVTPDANGGTLADGTTDLQTGTDGKLSALPDNPTRTGYTFSGWYTAQTGGEKVTTDTVFCGDTTIYAQWIAFGAQLTDLTVVGGTLNPAFDPGVTSYAVSLPYRDSDVTLIPTFGSGLTVTINGYPVLSGSRNTFTLNPGDTTVANIAVTNAEGGTNNYFITISRGTRPGNPPAETYPIDIEKTSNGSVSTNLSNASAGATITVTVTPDEGYVLGSLTVTGPDGRVDVTRVNVTTYTFKMPEGAVTVDASFMREGLPFTDVAANSWYYDAVVYVYNNGLMDGVSNTQFNPDGAMTRAMVWAILARIDGETITGSNWIADAQSWAVASGVSDGTNANGAVTRQELVTMLWRFAGEPETDATLSAWTDAASVADWAGAAMAWAVDEGVITGVSANAIDPMGGATRAQCATILMRSIDKI